MSDMHLTFVVLIVTAVSFLVPRFRADIVAICSVLALVFLRLLSVPDAFLGFSNTVVIMIASLFIVGEGVFQSGLALKAGELLVKLTGKNEFRLMMLMMIMVAVISAFISNTGTVAILLPIVVSLSRDMRIHPGKILMPLAFTSSIGGALTLIGTAPNLLASEALKSEGLPALSFFSFTPLGLIVLVVGIVFLWFIGSKLLDKPQEQDDKKVTPFCGKDLLEDYEALPYVHVLKIPKGHEAIGKRIKELQWSSTYGVSILEVIRRKKRHGFRLPQQHPFQRIIAERLETIREGDTLIVFADKASIHAFLLETGLQKIEEGERQWQEIEYANLAEVLLTPESRLINSTLQDMGFRENYGLTVISLRRSQKEVRLVEHDEKMKYGDVLLAHGKWEDINRLSSEKKDLIVLRQSPTIQEKDPVKLITAGVILAAMFVFLAFELLPAVLTVVLASLAMMLFGCIEHPDQAYRAINWQTVVLIACMLPMASVLEATGGVAFLSEGLTTMLGGAGPIGILAGLYILASLFSQFISNTATAVVLYPVAIMTSVQLGVSPLPMVMSVAYAAGMAFSTPIATPPNAMVMAAGKYSFFDFVKVGLPLQILVGFIIIVLLPVMFPF